MKTLIAITIDIGHGECFVRAASEIDGVISKDVLGEKDRVQFGGGDSRRSLTGGE